VLAQPLHQRRIAGPIAFLKIPWKISRTNFVKCSGSGSSKGGTTVEDQDRETRIEEDVEGHMHKNAPDMHKARNDEGEDVEGHMHKNAPDMHKARNDEDDDDVEAHMHKNQVNLGMHKN
jgi:hypothetical protein